MFKGVAATTGSITPNDLADGLGLAMRTTAAGLMIAPRDLWRSTTWAMGRPSTGSVRTYSELCECVLEGMSIQTNHSDETKGSSVNKVGDVSQAWLKRPNFISNTKFSARFNTAARHHFYRDGFPASG